MADRRTVRDLESKIEKLNKTIAVLEKKIETMRKTISDSSAGVQHKGGLSRSGLSDLSANSSSYMSSIDKIQGRHREILVLLINDGFHTYRDISERLNISQSRVRAYISELKNKYHVPLSRIRDADGYKVGVDMRFVER